MRITGILQAAVRLHGEIANAVVDFSEHTVSLVHAFGDFAANRRKRDALIVVHMDISVFSKELGRVADACLCDAKTGGDIHRAGTTVLLLLNEDLLKVVFD